MGTYEIRATTTTSAPPEAVWSVLDDFAGWTTWMPAMRDIKIELLSEGDPCPDYQFRVKGKLVHADLTVTTHTPRERRTSFRLSFPPLTGDNRCIVHPVGNGRYRIVRVDHLHLPDMFISFLNATRRAYFEQLAAEFLTALKRTAEERNRHGIAAPH